MRYLPAVPTLVADDEGGHGLIGAAGLHLWEDTRDMRAEHHTQHMVNRSCQSLWPPHWGHTVRDQGETEAWEGKRSFPVK